MARFLCVTLLWVILGQTASASDWLDAQCEAQAQQERPKSTHAAHIAEAEQVVKLITANAPVYAAIRSVVIDGGDVDALAEDCKNGLKLLVFDRRFIDNVRRTKSGTGPYWAWVFVAAHEVGHFWRNHGNLKMPCTPAHPRDSYCPCTATTPEAHKEFNRRQELEADFLAGYVLSKLGAGREDTLSAMHALDRHDSCTHPSRTRRAEAVSRGWQQARGQNQSSYSSGSPEDLKHFELVLNRDIYGGDYREIFGISIEACASNCLKKELCAAFSFDRWNNACFLKSSGKIGRRLGLQEFPEARPFEADDVILKAEPKSTVGIRRAYMKSLPATDTNSKLVTVRVLNRYFYDRPLQPVTRHADWLGCAKDCRSHGGCVAFNFYGGSCEKFDRTDGHYPSPGRSIGYFWAQNN